MPFVSGAKLAKARCRLPAASSASVGLQSWVAASSCVRTQFPDVLVVE